MSNSDDHALALTVSAWLVARGCTVSAVRLRDGEYLIYYTLKLDIVPQPAVRIRRGAVTFPAGSQEDILLEFLLSQ